MFRRHRRQRTKRCLPVLAWLVLLVVGLGLSRSLFVCTQPCCAGHVKLVAACAAAAEGEPGASSSGSAASCCHCAGTRVGAPAAGTPAVDPVVCGGCHHIALGVDFDLPPSAASSLPPALSSLASAPSWVLPGEVERHPVVQPPATGPPRTDRRTALLASTILRS